MILLNSEFVEDEAALTVRDRGLRGDGVFDTMKVENGKCIYADEHFGRLLDHAGVLKIPVPYAIDDLKNDAKRILDKTGVQNGCLTTTITRGPATRGLQTPDNPSPQIIMRAADIPSMDHIEVHAITAKTVRKNEGSPLSRIKSLNYGDHIVAKMEAEDKGVNEALLLNNQGRVCCFTIGNVFVLKDDKLLTPPLSDGCMDGIIRGKLLAQDNAAERSLTEDDLKEADAIYLTNSLRGVVQIGSLDGAEFTRKIPVSGYN